MPLTYFKYELKRAFRVFVHSLIFLVIVLGLIIGGIFAVSTWYNNKRIIEPVHIAMYVPGDDKTTSMALRLISGMESLESICVFDYVDDPEDVKSSVSYGEAAAGIVFPKGFSGDIYSGFPGNALLYLPSGSGDQNTLASLFAEILRAGVDMLNTARQGVGLMWNIGADREVVNPGTGPSSLFGMALGSFNVGDYTAYGYMVDIFDRERFYEALDVSPIKGIKQEALYSLIALTGLMLIYGINLLGLYKSYNTGFEDRLKVAGVHGFKGSIIRILTVWFLLLMVMLFGIIVLMMMERFLPGVFLISPGIFITCLIVSLFIALYDHLFFSFFKNILKK